MHSGYIIFYEKQQNVLIILGGLQAIRLIKKCVHSCLQLGLGKKERARGSTKTTDKLFLAI
jgi:hypothetical protein